MSQNKLQVFLLVFFSVLSNDDNDGSEKLAKKWIYIL